MLRVCYIWEMGFMVKTAELERLREKRIRRLRNAQQSKCWASTTNEQCPNRKDCDDRGCQLYADDFQTKACEAWAKEDGGERWLQIKQQ